MGTDDLSFWLWVAAPLFSRNLQKDSSLFFSLIPGCIWIGGVRWGGKSNLFFFLTHAEGPVCWSLPSPHRTAPALQA